MKMTSRADRATVVQSFLWDMLTGSEMVDTRQRQADCRAIGRGMQEAHLPT